MVCLQPLFLAIAVILLLAWHCLHIDAAAQNGSEGEGEGPLTRHVQLPAILSMLPPSGYAIAVVLLCSVTAGLAFFELKREI